MQPWALSLPDKELCLREALAASGENPRGRRSSRKPLRRPRPRELRAFFSCMAWRATRDLEVYTQGRCIGVCPFIHICKWREGRMEGGGVAALAFPLDLGARPLCRRLRGRGCANCQSLSQAELFVRQRERPGLHSQAVAWPPRRSAGRREAGFFVF